MLEFEESFFKREVRDGHLVGELVKKAWAVQLNMLAEIDDICKKYNLTYFAYWGTLIGAVRHQGFIPWDDDIDIALPRPDYTRFLEIASQELSSEYYILSSEVDGWDNSFSRLIHGDKICWNEEFLTRNYNCPFALGIDIFPLDYISSDKREAEEQKQLAMQISSVLTVLKERKRLEAEGAEEKVIQEMNNSIASCLVYLEDVCGVRFDGNVSLAKQLNILYDQVASLFGENESDNLTSFSSYLKNGYVVKKEWFERIERVPFENITIPIPVGYDNILRKSHGNYTIPIKGTSTHGDIYFRSQIKLLTEKLDFESKKEIPMEEQTEMILEVTANIKKEGTKYIFVCNDTYETIANDIKVVEKLRSVFSEFRAEKDVRIWWRPSRLDSFEMRIVEKFLPQLVEEYRELVKEFINSGLGFLDPGLNIDFALENCCAYYGVDNKISRLFQLSGKPVMIMNFDVK